MAATDNKSKQQWDPRRMSNEEMQEYCGFTPEFIANQNRIHEHIMKTMAEVAKIPFSPAPPGVQDGIPHVANSDEDDDYL